MIALALAALAAGALPQGEARYRFELGGEHVGAAELKVACRDAGCTVRWSVRTRSPEAAGGAIHARRVEVEVDRDGRWVDGALAVTEDGEPVGARGRFGAVPVSLAELVLARARSEAPPCVEVFDERTGEGGKACARRGAMATWELEVQGEAERVRMGAEGLPGEVLVPAQRARFVADPRADVPAQPPQLYGVAVPGVSPGAARSFCGVERDGEPPAVRVASLPAPAATGPSCREKTAHWLEAASRAGLRGRTAVGVAWDGAGFAWHAWAEVQVDGGWIPVDPSFGQLPARGPRFTLARWADGDEAARSEAGRRILACWGRARVQ